MSEQYPETFPYQAKSFTPLALWRKTCVLCGSSVEFPKRWGIIINGVHRYTMYGESNSSLILCGEKCACRYFWKDYCLKRLTGNL